MKYIIIFVLIITSLAVYLLWPTKYESDDWDSFKEEKVEVEEEKKIKEVEKIEKIEKVAVPTAEKKIKHSGFTKQEESEYFDDLRDTIKDQWKELEECENDFDVKFGDLLKMDYIDISNYLKDPNNLGEFLDNVVNFKGSTPSSAKMIKDLAMPIATQVDGNEIIETVGYVKTCRPQGKRLLIQRMIDSLKVDKKVIFAFLTFLENEASTLTYPRIMYENVYEIKRMLKILNINYLRYPELKRLEKSFQNFVDKDIRVAISASPFNPEIQRLAYEHALIIQKEIQKTLKAIKKDLLK